MLIRRVKDACAAPDVQCIGTSATMSTEGTQRRSAARIVAEVATRRSSGRRCSPENVIGETLIRATAEDAGPVTAGADHRARRPRRLRRTWSATRWPPGSRPAFGLDRDDEGKLARRAPATVQRAAAAAGGADRRGRRASARRRCSGRCRPGRGPGTRETGRPLFAFRLHQFLSKGDTVYVTLEDETTPAHHPRLPGRAARLGREGPAAAGVLPRMRPGVPGGLAAAPRTARSATWPARDATVSEDGRGRPPTPTATSTSRRDMPWPRDRETVIADRRAARVLAGGRRPHAGQDVSPADGPQVPPDPGDRGRLRSRERARRGGIEAAFIPGPFRFCLRCGVSYEQVRGRDFAKLATLDQEGRSSATTLISMSIVR